MTGGQKRALLFLALALCVVTALLWLPEREEQGEGAAVRVFPDIEAEDVGHIALQRGAGVPLVLDRSEGAWQITAPEPLLADTWRADSLASTLVLLRAQAPMAGADPADYGLDSDQALQVEFGPPGGPTNDLGVGDEAPVGGGTYILVGGEVRVAQGLALASLDTTLDALRDRSLWKNAPAEADFLAVARGDLRLEAVRREEGWFDGSGQPLDTEGIDTWLRGLAGLRATGFGPPAGVLVPVGQIEVRAGEELSQVVTVGQVEGDPAPWWRGPAQAKPVTLDDAGLEPLDEGVRLLGTPWEAAPPS